MRKFYIILAIIFLPISLSNLSIAGGKPDEWVGGTWGPDGPDVTLGHGMSTYNNTQNPDAVDVETGDGTSYTSLGGDASPIEESDAEFNDRLRRATDDTSCCSKQSCRMVLFGILGLTLLSGVGAIIFS